MLNVLQKWEQIYLVYLLDTNIREIFGLGFVFLSILLVTEMYMQSNVFILKCGEAFYF